MQKDQQVGGLYRKNGNHCRYCLTTSKTQSILPFNVRVITRSLVLYKIIRQDKMERKKDHT